MSRRAPPSVFDPAAVLLHRDASVLVIDKPVGWEVVSKNDEHDLVSELRRTFSLPELQPVHRLDLETSGCLVFAIGDAARTVLEAAFASREAEKDYIALCIRTPQPASGTIDQPLLPWRAGRTPVQTAQSPREPGAKPATTRYATVIATPPGSREPAALVWAQPVTGRTHQIRVHLVCAHAPILGDDSYGDRARNRIVRDATRLDRTALHAFRIRVPHPTSGNPLTVTAPLPNDMRAAAVDCLHCEPEALDVPALREAMRAIRAD